MLKNVETLLSFFIPKTNNFTCQIQHLKIQHFFQLLKQIQSNIRTCSRYNVHSVEGFRRYYVEKIALNAVSFFRRFLKAAFRNLLKGSTAVISTRLNATLKYSKLLFLQHKFLVLSAVGNI